MHGFMRENNENRTADYLVEPQMQAHHDGLRELSLEELNKITGG